MRAEHCNGSLRATLPVQCMTSKCARRHIHRPQRAQVVAAALRPVTEAIHMAPAQFDALAAAGLPVAFIRFLEAGATVIDHV